MYNLIHITPDSKNGNMFDRYIRNSNWIEPFILLRDINIQEELIDEYLKDYQVDAPTMEKVYELNRKYKKMVEDSEDVSRNVNWKLTNFMIRDTIRNNTILI